MYKKVLEPISSEHPCGKDFKYDDTYLKIEQEIDLDNSVNDAENTDWKKVLSMSEVILTEHSKDIKVLSWWITALWHTMGIEGVLNGIQTLSSLIESYGKDLFPSSERAKINVLTALEAFLGKVMLDPKANLENFTELERIVDIFNLCEASIQKNLGSELVFFSKVRSGVLRSIKARAAAASIKKTEKSAVEVIQVSSDNDAAKLMIELKKSMQKLASFKRESAPFSLFSLRLTRFLAWSEIEEMPMSEGKRTVLNPPSYESIEKIEQLQAENSLEEALRYTEDILIYAPFWMDGHVKVYELLLALEKDEAALYVINALNAFIQTFPKIMELTYADNTPFVSTDTKKYLHTLVSADTNENESTTAAPQETLQDHVSVLVKKKKFTEAMKLIEKAYKEAEDEQMRFLLRLEHAKTAIDINEMEVAKALLGDLFSNIEAFDLQRWNPSLAAEVYVLYLGNFKRLELDGVRFESIYSRLCKIDIASAVSVTSFKGANR